MILSLILACALPSAPPAADPVTFSADCQHAVCEGAVYVEVNQLATVTCIFACVPSQVGPGMSNRWVEMARDTSGCFYVYSTYDAPDTCDIW